MLNKYVQVKWFLNKFNKQRWGSTHQSRSIHGPHRTGTRIKIEPEILEAQKFRNGLWIKRYVDPWMKVEGKVWNQKIVVEDHIERNKQKQK